MKHHKNSKNRYDYDDEDDYVPSKKKDSPRRREVRNWRKAYENADPDGFYESELPYLKK